MKLPLRAYWQLLSAHIRPQQGRFIWMAILLLGSIGLQIVNPQIMRTFIDAALAGTAIQNLVIAALAFIGIAILQQIISVVVVYLSENVAWSATNALRAELARHCLNLDMGFHNNHTPGELIERIDGDVAELATFFSQFVIILAGNLILMIGILIALFLEDIRAGLAFGLYALIAVVILNKVRDIAVVHQKARRQAEADLFGFLEEQLASTEDVRSSGAIDFSLRELFRCQASILRHDRKAQYKNWIINLVMGGLLTLSNILAVGVGYYLYTQGKITIGTVYLFIHYINLLEVPIWTLTHEVQSFQTIGACIERLTALRQSQPKVLEAAEGCQLPNGPLELSFNQVSFSYLNGIPQDTRQVSPTSGNGRNQPANNTHWKENNQNELVLNGLSFQLKPGKILGLLGRTGSGKSTLARLIFRLYDPSSGAICLNGSDIRQAQLKTLRGRVAMVTQEVQLFQGSVRNNLTFFDASIPDGQILAAIQALGLDDWYRSLPNGLDTVLEGGGRSLSAGEAQQLAFTRVLLRDPGLVILDEASSRLDPASEQRIEVAIERLLQNRTAIIIAHRLGTVERADEVLILEDGEIGEYSSRQQLASNPASKFYHLLQTGLEEVLA
ncbi:MAG: ABC transporter ATP-binding protein [Anaerolineales bacterium]|nr:ABC transporter ATP-binding protein [Anaerolineales bacterium]